MSAACGLLLIAAVGCTSSTNDSAPPETTATTTTMVKASSRALPTTVEPAVDLPGYNVYRPTDLDATGAPLPVIVWANGGCLRYDAAWSPLLESWAAAGFVVVAITAPPDGADPRAAGITTADDQGMAIDWAEAQDADPAGPYAGHLDLDRVVAAGNSCGGITTMELAARDDRVRSAFVLSGSSVFPGSPREAAAALMGGIDVPVGYVNGGPEDISTGPIQQDYELVPAGVPAYAAHRSSATHQVVSTDPSILAEVAEISTNWIDFTLYGNPELERTLLDDPCGACAPAPGPWRPRTSTPSCSDGRAPHVDGDPLCDGRASTIRSSIPQLDGVVREERPVRLHGPAGGGGAAAVPDPAQGGQGSGRRLGRSVAPDGISEFQRAAGAARHQARISA